jgi:hypothetical protein
MPAGYSGTPLPRKLGIKDGFRVLLVSAPRELERELQPLPTNVVLTETHDQKAEVIIAFFTERASLATDFEELARTLQPAGGLWIAWPKKASGVATDLNENVIRDIGLAAGLVDNKVCAISDVWSGLRFVYRLKDRPSANPLH